MVDHFLWLIMMGNSIGTMNLPGTSLNRKRLWCPSMEQAAEVEFLARGGMVWLTQSIAVRSSASSKSHAGNAVERSLAKRRKVINAQ